MILARGNRRDTVPYQAKGELCKLRERGSKQGERGKEMEGSQEGYNRCNVLLVYELYECKKKYV